MNPISLRRSVLSVMARQLMASLPADILGVMPSEAGSEATKSGFFFFSLSLTFK